MWHLETMSRFRPIRLLLPLLAVLGLLVAPLAAPALSNTMQPLVAMAGMPDMQAEMPCCPPETPALPDCQKNCPLASMCLVKCLQATAFAETAATDFGVLRKLRPENDASRERAGPSPQPRPPRT
jgi:hypothetical protein